MNPEEAAQTIREKAPRYGEAKAQRVYLEEFRKSKKALLMKDALVLGYEAANAQEREAYRNPTYIDHLDAMKTAIYNDEKLRFLIEAARAKISAWQTMSKTGVDL